MRRKVTKHIKFILIICSVFTQIEVKAISNNNIQEITHEFNNPEQICNAVKNGIIKIGIDNYYNQTSYYMKPITDKCNNFNNPTIMDVIEGEEYSSWVRFGQNDSKHDYYYDDIIGSKEEKRYFFINNSSTEYNKTTKKIKQQSTLKPGENIFVEADLNDIDSNNLNTSNLKDLRLTLTYGLTTSDRNISLYNSIAYYVYTNDTIEYGPYRLADAYFINRNYYGNGNPTTKIDEYQLISENLLNNIPKNKVITKIKIVPYEFFPIHSGAFRFYSITLNNYKTGYEKNKEYINILNAEDKIRHNIVNNMMDVSTLKWNISPSSQVQLNFYSHLGTTNPKIYNPNSKNIYYGIPYVNTIDSTINSFLSQTTKNQDGFYSYNLTEKYLEDTQSTKFKKDNPNSSELNIKKGNPINNNLYVYEVYESNDIKPIRKSNLEQNDFVINKPGYFFGQDCSSSTFYAVGTELPYLDSMAGSRRYYFNNQVKILGNLDFTYRGLENFLRKNNILNNTNQSTITNYDNYYSTYIKRNNNQQQIYNGYALLMPGDFVSKSGHIRMISGYTHVVCNDGTSTNKYNEGFCNNHDEINPDASYVITTEIGGSKYLEHINSSETGWNIKLSNNTDIKNVDDLWKYSKELDNKGKEVITYNIDPTLRSFNINAKYTFSSLYGEENSIDDEIDSDPGMYLPFRYIAIDKTNQNIIEKPNARIILDKEYNNINEIMTTYIKENKRLKGILSTNYIINGIKIDINNKKYYIYPNQTNIFSLYKDITNDEILNKIENIDYNSEFVIKISINYGPNINEVKEALNADNEGYYEILKLTNVPTVNELIKGDMNKDGTINFGDVIIALRKYLNIDATTEEDIKIGDMNNTGKIEFGDIITILRLYLGII